MDFFINDSAIRPELFLSNMPLWVWQIQHYPILMMIWNIILVVIALYLTYLLVQYIKKPKKNYWLLALLALAWLVMAPNAPYLMTETRHSLGPCLSEYYNNVCLPTAWTPVFFFGFAAIGWVSFVWTVRPVEVIIKKLYGRQWSLAFITIIIPLLSLGLLLGLVNRWNSWELISEPGEIIRSALLYFLDLTYLENYFIMTFLLAVLYSIGSKVFVSLSWEKSSSRS